MERSAWTDAPLDDLAQRMDAGFERVDRDIRELRADVGTLRSEMHGEFGALRVTLLRIGGGVMVGLIGVIAALVAGG
jgi:hypothetical protein